nr:MAG TPA: hypothetical protein [Caudoviricetes sp.]
MDSIKISVDVNVHLSEKTENFISSLVSKLISVPAPASAAPASAAPTLTIDDVRKVVASKAAAHRDEVKAKLTELGAKNVTTLDPSKYQALVDYLNTLA